MSGSLKGTKAGECQWPPIGSLLGVSRWWSACGWSVVQLDHDEEMGPMHGMHGTWDAELEVRRTMKSAVSL